MRPHEIEPLQVREQVHLTVFARSRSRSRWEGKPTLNYSIVGRNELHSHCRHVRNITCGLWFVELWPSGISVYLS